MLIPRCLTFNIQLAFFQRAFVDIDDYLSCEANNHRAVVDTFCLQAKWKRPHSFDLQQKVTSKQLNSLSKVLAWQLRLHYIQIYNAFSLLQDTTRYNRLRAEPTHSCLGIPEQELPFKSPTEWGHSLPFYGKSPPHLANRLLTVNCVTDPQRAPTNEDNCQGIWAHTDTNTHFRSVFHSQWLTPSIVWWVFTTITCEGEHTILLFKQLVYRREVFFFLFLNILCYRFFFLISAWSQHDAN